MMMMDMIKLMVQCKHDSVMPSHPHTERVLYKSSIFSFRPIITTAKQRELLARSLADVLWKVGERQRAKVTL